MFLIENGRTRYQLVEIENNIQLEEDTFDYFDFLALSRGLGAGVTFGSCPGRANLTVAEVSPRASFTTLSQTDWIAFRSCT